jgi:hypothetical protein
MNAGAKMIHLDVNDLWTWYWVGKAQLTMPSMPGLDQLVTLWNWLLANDVVRVGALVVVAVWLLLTLIDSLLTEFAPPTPLTAADLLAELVRLNRTQSELAAELGVDRSYISHLIRGKKPFRTEMQLRCRVVFQKWSVTMVTDSLGTDFVR